MNFKKLVCTAMAGVMALSLSVPALAADPNVTSSEPVDFEITGTTNVPSIKVTIATAGDVVVNPYKLTWTDADDNEFTDQIIFATEYIESLTNAALDVTATVTGVIPDGSKATFATAPTQGGKAVTTNSVFMYLEMGAATATDGTGDPVWADAYEKTNTKQLLVGTTPATSKTALVTIPAAADATTASYAAFKLCGDAADKPATPWTANDKVSVTVAFTFTPVVTAAETPAE